MLASIWYKEIQCINWVVVNETVTPGTTKDDNRGGGALQEAGEALGEVGARQEEEDGRGEAGVEQGSRFFMLSTHNVKS